MLGSEQKEIIILPRGYLSWSQLSCWKTSKERYKREYFEKSSKLDTKFLRFGKVIAKMIEDGTHHVLLPNLVVYDQKEHYIKTLIGGRVWVVCYLDGNDPIFNIFGEYKTGKLDKKGNVPWNLAKVQKHDQLTFYALARKAETGSMPEFADLHWIETMEDVKESGTFFGNDSKIVTTGRIESFRRYFDERELDRMEADIISTALEISAAYIEWLQEL